MSLILLSMGALAACAVMILVLTWFSGSPQPLTRDEPGVHSFATFRDLALPSGEWAGARRPLFSRLCELACARGFELEAVETVGGARRARVSAGGVRLAITLGRDQGSTGLWLLTVDEVLGRALSAPRDEPDVRDALGRVRDVVHELPVGSVRWYQRQDWEAGLVERWNYKPC